MERRNTVQKELVLGAVQSLRSHVTADMVYQFVVKDHPSVGKGTVYRNLNILAEEGAIKRILISNGSDRYDFTTADHYHVQCVECEELFDVDMDYIPDMESKIHDTHGIQFLDYDILFHGICKDCQNLMRKEK